MPAQVRVPVPGLYVLNDYLRGMRRTITTLAIDATGAVPILRLTMPGGQTEDWPLSDLKAPATITNVPKAASAYDGGGNYILGRPLATADDMFEVHLFFNDGRSLRIDYRDVQSPTYASAQALANAINTALTT